MLAAVKACGPGAILSHMSAAMLWGFADRDEERAPEVTVIGDGARSHPGIRVHRTARIDGCDWRVWQAIPATTPARTMLDISATVDGKPLRSLVRRAQGTGSVGLRQLCEVVERLGPRKGSRRLALAIVGGPAPTRSVLEDIVLDLLLDAGFERPDINKPIVVGGRRVIPDFRWPDQHLIIEADSAAWHDGKAATEADAERQALLEAQGERVIRVTWHQALLTPELTRRRIQAAGAPPAR